MEHYKQNRFPERITLNDSLMLW